MLPYIQYSTFICKFDKLADKLNSFAVKGWKLVDVIPNHDRPECMIDMTFYVIMEREVLK